MSVLVPTTRTGRVWALAVLVNLVLIVVIYRVLENEIVEEDDDFDRNEVIVDDATELDDPFKDLGRRWIQDSRRKRNVLGK